MALVTPAAVQDNQPALDLLWRTRFRWKLRPRQVTGATKYGTVEHNVAIEREGIRADVPLSAVGPRPGSFGEQAFRYDPAPDRYSRPGEKTLRFLSQCDRTRRRIYQAATADCAVCPLRSRCTLSHCGRRVSRNLDADVLDRVRGYHTTEE